MRETFGSQGRISPDPHPCMPARPAEIAMDFSLLLSICALLGWCIVGVDVVIRLTVAFEAPQPTASRISLAVNGLLAGVLFLILIVMSLSDIADQVMSG